jgi:hypothetical protein
MLADAQRYATIICMSPLSLILFAVGCGTIIYVINCLVAGRVKKIDPRQAALYMSTVALIGLFGEIFLDTTYNWIVGRPLWYYNILPIQGGYTSSYAIVAWGLYGLHIYLLHGSLADKWSITCTKHLALIFCVEALILEAMLTIGAKVFLGQYMYYYLPGDLWHVTSIQNLPFYLICGVVILKTLKRFRTDPRFFTLMSLFLIGVLVFMTK